MKIGEKDIFDILSISGKEDSFTDLLCFIFNKCEIFKERFTQYFLGEAATDAKFLTRSSYQNFNNDFDCKVEGTRNKITPDIILCSKEKNIMAIIEVKIYASEGLEQTQSYFKNTGHIIGKLTDKNYFEKAFEHPKCKYWFLTLSGDSADCERFTPVSWRIFTDLLPDDFEMGSSDEMLKILVSHLKERCKSLSVKQDKYNINDNWVDVVKTVRWVPAHELLFKILMNECFENFNPDKEIAKHWYDFEKSDNCLIHSVLVGKKSWLSSKNCKGAYNQEAKKFITIPDISVNNCYDVHFEFKLSENFDCHELDVRLDYHLNPYLSTNKIDDFDDDGISTITEMNKKRKEISENIKQEWEDFTVDDISLNKNWKFNRGDKHNVMFLIKFKSKIKIMPNDTIKTITDIIRPFIDIATKFVDEKVIPEIISA